MDTPRNSHLCHQYCVFSDYHVMGHLHQVIQLCPPLDPCLAQGSPVNTTIGPYLHVVINLDDTRLRDLHRSGTIPNISESIASYNTARVDDYLVSNQTIVQDRDIGINQGLLSDLDAIANENTWEEDSPLPYSRPFPNVHLRIDGDVLPYLTTLMDDGPFADASKPWDWGSEKARHLGIGQLGIGNRHLRSFERWIFLWHKHRRCLGFLEDLLVPPVSKKRDLSRARTLQAVDPCDHYAFIANHPPLNALGDFPKG